MLVGIQQALLGEIDGTIRAVTVSYTENNIHFSCYLDGSVSEDHVEAMSCAETELIAMFPSNHKVTHELIRLDYPAQIPKTCEWVYYRKEG